MSRSQLNQKLKLMVEALRYVIYSNTPHHTRALLARSVDATHVLLIHGAKYSTLNEGWLRFKPVTFCHTGSDAMSRNQLNQKLKLMVEAP